MLKKLPLLLLIIFISCKAQEKVKGSRNVKTEQYDLSSFHSIQAKGDFKIGILKGNRSMIEIEADDNLHDLIQSEVRDGILYIKPFKEFSRTKKQELRITFSDTLKDILITDDVELESLQDIYVGDFKLETRNDAQAILTIKAKDLRLIQNDDAKSELNITATTVDFQLNQSSDLKALVNAPDFNVDIYEKATARIEGDVQRFKIRADQSANFDGENLTSVTAELLAQRNAEIKINVTDTLNVRSTGKSEIEVFNEPQINLIEFKDEAVISKKEFSKGLFQ